MNTSTGNGENENTTNSGSSHQVCTVKADITDENYMQPDLHSEIPTNPNIAYRGNSISLANESYNHSPPSFSIDNEDTDQRVNDVDEARDVPIHSYDEPHTFWNQDY